MTAARSSWKRLHTDVEDGDECLPISKRICSLHIESQSQDITSQTSHGAYGGPYDGFSGNVATLGPPLLVSNGFQQYSTVPQSSGRLDFNNELSPPMKTHSQNDHNFCVQDEVNQRHVSAGPVSHFCHSMNGQSPTWTHQQKLDHTCNQLNPSNLMYIPDLNYNQQNLVDHNQHMSGLSSIQNEHSTIHGNIHTDLSCHPHLENMPEYNHEFHSQQLPSGNYDPELGMEDNPYYYSVNQMLYEAHLYRVRRGNNFPNNSLE